MWARFRLRLSGRLATVALMALMAFLLASSGQASAQGFGLGQLLGGGGGSGGGSGSGGNGGGGLSQLFGGGSGGGGPRHQQYQQSDSASGISVERSAPPLTGKFTGKQDSSGMQTTITAQFACYPAHDADIPQSNAFVCYTGNPNAGGPPSSGRSDAGGNGPPAGGSGYGANGPPPGVE
jgi:hypothetical protein